MKGVERKFQKNSRSSSHLLQEFNYSATRKIEVNEKDRIKTILKEVKRAIYILP